jgi:hypothetical protein
MLEKSLEILKQMLDSKVGYCFSEGIYVKIFNKVNILIDNDDKCVRIRFSNNKPILTIKKIIRLSLGISGIDLKDDGGTIIIDNFPDIDFSYEDL